jgi:hypothetical protein
MKSFSETCISGTYWVPFINEEGIEIFCSLVEYENGSPVDYDPEIQQFWNLEECMNPWYSDEFIPCLVQPKTT